MEVEAVRHVARWTRRSRSRSRGRPSGRPRSRSRAERRRHQVRLIPFLPGRHVEPSGLSPAALQEMGRVTARVGRALRGFFHPAAGRTILWDLKHLDALRPHLDAVTDPARRARWSSGPSSATTGSGRAGPARPCAQVIHNDLTLDNLLLDGDRVTGILDFGDMAHTALVLDLPAMLQSVLRGRTDLFEAAAEAIGGYVAVTPLESEEADLLADLLAARMVQTVLISVWRTAEFDNAYITGWLEPAYELLEQLEATGWEEASRTAGGTGPGPGLVRGHSESELAQRRRAVLGSALSPLTYERPLHLVRGEGVWLFDAQGHRYLDAYNNVPVVGHAPGRGRGHRRPGGLLNTNTRYLHEAVVLLAERIVAMPPGPRHGHVREQRQRGERPRLAPGHGLHGCTASSAAGRTTG